MRFSLPFCPPHPLAQFSDLYWVAVETCSTSTPLLLLSDVGCLTPCWLQQWFSLCEQNLPPQYISLFLISPCKLPECGSWPGVACHELPGDRLYWVVRRKGRKLCLQLKVWWRPCTRVSPVTLLPQRNPSPQTSCGEVMLVTHAQWICGAEAGEASLELAWWPRQPCGQGRGSHPQFPGYGCSSPGLLWGRESCERKTLVFWAGWFQCTLQPSALD